MKNLFGIVAIFITYVFISCGESEHTHDQGGKSQNAAAEPNSPTDSLLEEVFVYHDEAMPKMGKLKSYEDLAKLKIDSLANLKDAQSKKLKATFEKLRGDLQAAQKGMNDWMDGFRSNKYADKDSLFQYFLQQKAQAQAMRNEIFTVLDSAAVKFGK